MDCSSIIKSPLPTFRIKLEPHYEDQTDIFLAQRQKKLLDATSRAEKLLDILDFTFNVEQYDLRDSWSYWEERRGEEGLSFNDKGEMQPLYWPGCFAAGKTAQQVQQKGPDQTKWPGWLVSWCKR